MKAKNLLLISYIIFLGCKDSPRKYNIKDNSKIDSTYKKEGNLKNFTLDSIKNTKKRINSLEKIDKRLIVEFEGNKYIKRNVKDGGFHHCPDEKPSKVIFYDVVKKEYYDVRTGKTYIIYEQGRPCKGVNTDPEIKVKLNEIIIVKDSTK